MQAQRRGRLDRRRRVPEEDRARDQAVRRLQGLRADRDHVRPSAADRTGSGSERLLRKPDVSEPAGLNDPSRNDHHSHDTTTPAPATGEGATTPTGGGGQVGLLLISSFVKAGSSDQVDYYNHFSLLASIEDLFGLKHLGYASDPALPRFDGATYNAKKPG
jgi:hypothetical protein